MGDMKVGWKVGLMVGYWDVGAIVGKNKGLLDGVLVVSCEGGKDGIQLGFGVTGKLDAGVGTGVIDEVVGEEVLGVALFPRTTTTVPTIVPTVLNAMTSTIPKHSHLPPGVRVSGKQFMTVVRSSFTR